jgi:hypothetical protein
MLNRLVKLILVSLMLFANPVATVLAQSTLSLTILSPNGGEVLKWGDVYRITWQSSSEIDMVTIGYKSCPSCLDWIAYNIPNTGYYDWNVFVGNTTNTQFTIEIIGYDTGVGSTIDYSDAPFTVLPLQLSAPVLLTPLYGQVVAKVHPTFDWADVPYATGYTLQASTSSDFSNLVLNINTVESFETSSKLPKKTYIYWRVRAFGPINPSDWATGFFELK